MDNGREVKCVSNGRERERVLRERVCVYDRERGEEECVCVRQQERVREERKRVSVCERDSEGERE